MTKVLTVMLLATLLAAGLCLSGTALAQTTTVSISPASQTVPQGQTFTVDVYINPAVAIAGATFNLAFNASLLTANSVTQGNLFAGFVTFFNPGTINNTAGTITNIFSAITQSGGGSVTTPGVLATISFTAKTALGTSPLTLSSVTVGDPAGQPVSLTVNNGQVTVVQPPPTPTSVPTPTPTPPPPPAVLMVTPSPNTVSELAAYTVNIRTSKQLQAGDSIVLDFPDAVTVPATISRSYVAVGGCALTADDPQPVVDTANMKVIITIPQWIAAILPATFDVKIAQGAGIRNPAIAKLNTDSSPYEMKVTATYEDLGKLAYTILPSYKIGPTQGGRSTPVPVTGKGWTPYATITVGGALLPVVGQVQNDGTFSVTANPLTSGIVWCRDGSGRGSPSSGAGTVWPITEPIFTVPATVTVEPLTGNVGSTVIVSGYDFTPGGTIPAAVGIKIGGLDWGPPTPLVLCTRDAYGTNDDFQCSLSVPYTMNGSQVVQVTDNATKTAQAGFVINSPVVTVTPTSGPPGTFVTLTGSNFGAGDAIPVGGITFSASAWNNLSVPVDSFGSWGAVLSVPQDAVEAPNQVYVMTLHGTTAQAFFVVTRPAWDTNRDGCVSVLDVILVGQRFDQMGTPGWVNEDVNKDGVISVLDIILIGQHFGEGCG